MVVVSRRKMWKLAQPTLRLILLEVWSLQTRPCGASTRVRVEPPHRHSASISANLFANCYVQGGASCYFPIELQGDFVMQSSVVPSSTHVQYSKVSITAESIPIWGRCHQRIGSNVMLMDSSGGANCIRCFHLKLHSRNILEVLTEGLDKCYTSEDAARVTCPNSESFGARSTKGILLYKTHDYGGKAVQHEYCPISGHFTYTYNVDDGLEDKLECPNSVSQLNNCPYGSELNLRFRGCSFDNHDITFKCLGHWVGAGNLHYLALLDTRMGDQTPQYRCAIYNEEPGTGRIHMAFSSDSTCTANLHSSTKGYEVLTLTADPEPSWPEIVTSSSCRFPDWAQGHWEHLYLEGNTLTFKDHVNLKTYTMLCIGSNYSTEERFPVFTRTQCGEEMYKCIWIKRRGMNVLEFQIGGQSSVFYNSSLCADYNFLRTQWITQGRLERLQESPCPVTGEYTGYIPDATGLCAKLSSDCKSPEIMYYTVSDCSGTEVYEGRRRHGRNRRQVGAKNFDFKESHFTTYSSVTSPISNNFHQSTLPFTQLQHHTYFPVSSSKIPNYGHFTGREYEINDSKTKFRNIGTYDFYRPSEYMSQTFGHEYRGLLPKSDKDRRNSAESFSSESYDPWQFHKTHGHTLQHTPETSTLPYGFRHESSTTYFRERHYEYYNTNLSDGGRSAFASSTAYRNYSQHFISGYNSAPPEQNVHQTRNNDNRNIARQKINLYQTVPREVYNTGIRDLNNGEPQFSNFGRNTHTHPPITNFYQNPVDLPFRDRDAYIPRPIQYQHSQYPDVIPRPLEGVPEERHYSDNHQLTTSFPSDSNYHDSRGRSEGYITRSQVHTRTSTLSSRPELNIASISAQEIYNRRKQSQNVNTTLKSFSKQYSSRNTVSTKTTSHSVSISSSQETHPYRNDNSRVTIQRNPDSQRNTKGVNYNGKITPLPQSLNTRDIHAAENVAIHHTYTPPAPLSFHQPLPDPRPASYRSGATVRKATSSEREGREYRCLGQWKENGHMYTYTQRKDVGTFECFVGSIASDVEIFIKEAGGHCQRDVDPLQYGMKLTRIGPCFGNQPSTEKSMQSHHTMRSNKYLPNPDPTKPWKPITAPPKPDVSGQISLKPAEFTLFVFGKIVLVLYQLLFLR